MNIVYFSWPTSGQSSPLVGEGVAPGVGESQVREKAPDEGVRRGRPEADQSTTICRLKQRTPEAIAKGGRSEAAAVSRERLSWEAANLRGRNPSNTPHPPLRGTFSHRGRRGGRASLAGTTALSTFSPCGRRCRPRIWRMPSPR